MNEQDSLQQSRREGDNLPYNLIDGATGQVSEVTEEVRELKDIAADREINLTERLEAYEDIFESEVGDSTLVRARNIEREMKIRQVFLKFEGSNPTGTQKDRIAFSQSLDAMRRGYDAITVATCGNYGVAVALAASMAGVQCHIFLPETYKTSRIKEMTDLGAQIFRTDGGYEEAVERSREHAEKNEVYDANPGGANTNLQLRAYGEIAYEIYDELRDAPQAVAVPVSNGTTLAGVFRGFVSLYRRGKTSRMPRMIAGSSHGKNPIVQAFLKKLPTCEDLRPEDIRETRINEPLINWRSIDGDLALNAVRDTNGWAGDASDKNLMSYSRLVREREGLHVLPASTAGLIAMLDQHKQEPLINDRYVVILTGRKT